MRLQFLAIAAAFFQNASPGSGREPDIVLPSPHQEIVLRVSGGGYPACQSYWPDGSIRPCYPTFFVKQMDSVDAWSRSGNITFTKGAIEKLSEAEFALLAGHEIAHWYLGHNGSSPKAELEADKLGFDLACNAGFNVESGLGLFRHIRSNRSHGKAADRTAAIQAMRCSGRTIGPFSLQAAEPHQKAIVPGLANQQNGLFFPWDFSS